LKIIVDTCIWTLALRNDVENSSDAVRELRKLILDQQVQMVGPVRQELLSGIRSRTQLNDLKNYLSAFPDLPIETQDHELAAEYFNISLEKGIQGSSTDFLICALASRYKMPIYTEDEDFFRFAESIPIMLYDPK